MFPLREQHGNTTCIKAVCTNVPPSSAVYSAHLSYVRRQRHMHTQIGQDHCFLMCEVPKWASPPGATAASVLVQGEMSITLPSFTSHSLRMAKEEWKGGLEGRWREVKVTESLPNRWGRRRDEEPNSRTSEGSKGCSANDGVQGPDGRSWDARRDSDLSVLYLIKLESQLTFPLMRLFQTYQAVKSTRTLLALWLTRGMNIWACRTPASVGH